MPLVIPRHGSRRNQSSAPSREPFSTANGKRFIDQLTRTILDGVRQPH